MTQTEMFEQAARDFDAIAADPTRDEYTRGFAAHMAAEARRHAEYSRYTQ